MADKPIHATLFAYNVGFGDCFLLRFHYADGDLRHMLIDFGTVSKPKGSSPDLMVRIAEDIAAKCAGKLHAVVATHRHQDHISGFTPGGGDGGSGAIVRALQPEVVIQPWTEAPDAPVDWQGPPGVDHRLAFAAHRMGLAAMHETAQNALHFLEKAGNSVPEGLRDQIAFIGEDNLANLEAVRNLQTMGRRNKFVFHGCDLDLSAEFPGVQFDVLGPPTLQQTATISTQRATNRDEFWHLTAQRMAIAAGRKPKAANSEDVEDAQVETIELFPDADERRAGKMPAEYRWLRDRIDRANAELALGLVRSLDKAMNNTSVILVMRAGGKTLLFPGDAQWENWAYALASPLASLLDNVDVYKVGHHGSLNATPKSMWNRFAKRGGRSKPNRLTSVVSTKHGKHGSVENDSEVPRGKLMNELDEKSNLISTETPAPAGLYREISIPL